ncbi:MAG: hypothetical protein AB7E79_14105 [Rhodospirillaceae bacterium]
MMRHLALFLMLAGTALPAMAADFVFRRLMPERVVYESAFTSPVLADKFRGVLITGVALAGR